MYIRHICGSRESTYQCDWYDLEPIPIAEDPMGDRSRLRLFRYGSALAVYMATIDWKTEDQLLLLMNESGTTVDKILPNRPMPSPDRKPTA